MTLAQPKRLNVLVESPLDHAPAASRVAETTPAADPVWVPSRYNIRATMADGRLVLWNTMTGRISTFEAEDVESVVDMLSPQGFQAPREEAVKELADRGFLVRHGVNEYRQFQLLFGQQQYRTDVLELILLPSEDCNFRCKYCYEDFARGTMLPEVRQGIKRLVESRMSTLKHLTVRWFGGEPLYGWAAMEELGPFFAEVVKTRGISFTGHITTNGYLMTPDVVDKLLAWGVRGYQVTLDGAPEDHDCSRPARDGSGTFWTIFENIKQMARRKDDFNFQLRVNYDLQNYRNIGKLLDLVKAEFQDDERFFFSFVPVGKWGGPNDPQLPVCGADDWPMISDQLMATVKDAGLRMGTLKGASHPGAQACYAGRPYNLLIGATGKVMKCTIALDKDERNIVGQLHPDGRLDLDLDRMSHWTEPSFESDKQCQKCAVLPTCQGLHCPLQRMDNNEPACTPTRRYAKGELRYVLATEDRDRAKEGMAEKTS